MQQKILVNPNFSLIPPNYLFRDIGQRVQAFEDANPDKNVIRLGIGDVTEPLEYYCLHAGHDFLSKASQKNPGYPSGEGITKLRVAICDVYYNAFDSFFASNVVIGNGAKEDSACIQELFAKDIPVYITDPVYPVYQYSNLLAGRKDIRLMSCTEENGFMPDIPDLDEPSLIYLCFPNNPTGECATKEYLEKWVKAAKESGSVIISDIAYRDFITDPNLPKSIYEIDGAREVAIEIGSFSKSAGFTGIRVSWTTIPSELKGVGTDGIEVPLIDLWTKYVNFTRNGVPGDHQEMAFSAITDGREHCLDQVNGYLENAKLILKTFNGLGIKCWGGVNSPYVWAKTPNYMGSWDFFDLLLNQCAVVCTPGEGFGESGKGYFRLSAFNDEANVVVALERISKLKF